MGGVKLKKKESKKNRRRKVTGKGQRIQREERRELTVGTGKQEEEESPKGRGQKKIIWKKGKEEEGRKE